MNHTVSQKSLPARAFATLQLPHNAIILDVRTPKEWNEKHIKGAIHIDYLSDDFKSSLERLDKEKVYYVYCRAGQRSSLAIHIMQQMGFTQCINISDGMIGIINTNIELVHS